MVLSQALNSKHRRNSSSLSFSHSRIPHDGGSQILGIQANFPLKFKHFQLMDISYLKPCKTPPPLSSARRENCGLPSALLAHKGCISSLLNCIHVSLTCVLPLHLSSSHSGCMERCKETKERREEMRKDVLREMRRPFLGGVTWSDIPLWWHGAAGFAAESGWSWSYRNDKM